MGSRPNSADPSASSAINFDSSNENQDLVNIIQQCSQNLQVLDNFILRSKESVRERQTFLTAIQNIQSAFRYILINFANNSATSVNNLEEKITKIVENAIEKKLGNSDNLSLGPRYSQILKTNLSTNSSETNAPAKLPETLYKVIVKPNESLKNVKSPEDTRKILTSKLPCEYGIKVNKIVPLRNNAILIESNCASLLNLTENQTLKDLDLSAERVNKVWPKIQIFDVPNDMSENDLITEISRQNLPDNIPQNFVKSAFKIGNNQENNNNTWVVEIHPAARNYLIKNGSKVYFRWRALNIRDYFKIARCFKCQKFGHVSKHCKSDKQCGYCTATNHESIDCIIKNDETKYKCCNCIRAKQPNSNHFAGSSNCPVYKYRLQEAIKNIDFDG